ncbi:MAG: Type 1 glutamine amidotransferase-like domain-containing protein [Candidatus Paceibacterota bacterium]
MKMYLSSYRLGDDPQQLANLIGTNKKVAVIANSIDFGNDPERRKAGVQREIEDLTTLGLQPEELDLRNYFGKPQELEKKLSEYGTLWVRGGNTFILRRAFKESGLDDWLISQKDNKELVYAGYSAGVCILSPTLKGLELVDDPVVVSDGYPKETIWEGLGLIDFAFAPHFESPGHPETEAVGKEVEYYKKAGVEYKALHDGEVIIKEF